MFGKKTFIGLAIVVAILATLALYLEHNKPIYKLVLSNGRIVNVNPGEPATVLADRIVLPENFASGEYILSDGGPGIVWLNREDTDRTRAVAYFATPAAQHFGQADRIDLEPNELQNISDYLSKHMDGKVILDVKR